jgi:hypothetical protein
MLMQARVIARCIVLIVLISVLVWVGVFCECVFFCLLAGFFLCECIKLVVFICLGL